MGKDGSSGRREIHRMHQQVCPQARVADNGSRTKALRFRILAALAGATVAMQACATAPDSDLTSLSGADLEKLPTLEVEKDCNLYKSPNFVGELARRGLIQPDRTSTIVNDHIIRGMSEAEVFCALPKEFILYGQRQVTESQFGEMVMFIMPATTRSAEVFVTIENGQVASVTYG